MTTTRRAFPEAHKAAADDAGWQFVAPASPVADPDTDGTPPQPARRMPSLSWRLRH